MPYFFAMNPQHSAHPWHGVSPGPKPPSRVHALIEIPRESRAKYEVDKATGMLRLDRVLPAAMHYPAHYGFIPQSLGEDGDPLDILVLCQSPLVPLTLLNAHVVAMMPMRDSGEMDEKIIAVAEDDPAFGHIRHLDELPPHFQTELRHFFETYKELRHKEVLTDNFLPAAQAHAVIVQALARYKQAYPA
jgi:inorganic pyrophosphatase